MAGISRSRFESTFDNHAIDVEDPMARAYDAINALDRRTPDLASPTEVAVYGAFRRAAVAPAPISAAQGRQLAAAARQMLADDATSASGASPWSLAGTATCRSTAIDSPRYAGAGVWKCNVFVGEAFNRDGLPFPLSSVGHYASANSLAARSASFEPVANLKDVRPGDLVSINRRGESGHVEIVTSVDRGPDGQARRITTLGAHEQGLAEGTTTAAPLVQVASRADGQLGADGVTIGGETFHVLRPMAPPLPPRDTIHPTGPIKG